MVKDLIGVDQKTPDYVSKMRFLVKAETSIR